MTVQNNFWKGFQDLMQQLNPDNQARPGTAPTNAATSVFGQAPANNFGSFLSGIKMPGAYQGNPVQQNTDFSSMNQWGINSGPPAALPQGSYAEQIRNLTTRNRR